MQPTEADWQAFQPIRRRSDVLVLRVLRDEQPHTQAEIAEATGLNISNVSRSLKVLRDDGLVRYDDGAHRLAMPFFAFQDRLRNEVDAHLERIRGVQAYLREA